MGLCLSAQAARRDCGSQAARSRQETRLAPPAQAHLRDGRSASNPDIRKVSLWLGHATLTTTEVYTRGDPTEKLNAMEAIVPPHLRRGVFQPTDHLIELLRRTS